MFYQCFDLPSRENCPSIVEVIQNPKEKFSSYLVCMELPEFPKSLATIVRVQDQSAVKGTSTATTITSTSGTAGTSTITTTSSNPGIQGGTTTTTTTL